MPSSNDPESEDAAHAEPQPPGGTHHQAATYAEPTGLGSSALWWLLSGVGVLVIAGLVGLAIWGASEDDDANVAGVQSQSVDIVDDEGFTAQQAEIDIGDSVELTNVGTQECALAVNGEQVAVVRAGETYAWRGDDTGDYTFTCDGRSGEMRVTVNQ